MVEILKELGNLAERGPIVVSLIAFGAILIVIKSVMPITKESVATNSKLAAAIDRLSDTCGAMRTALVVVEKKVDQMAESVNSISDRIDDHTETIEVHEIRISTLEHDQKPERDKK